MSTFKGFSSVQLQKPQRSYFDMTHDKRISTRMGKLTPCLIMEAIPGDAFHGSSEMLVRLAPMLAPIYDQIQVYVHYFFVPNRILWDEWETFITGGRLGVGIDPVNAPIPPYINLGTVEASTPQHLAKGSVADYLGVPLLLEQGTDYSGLSIDALPFAAWVCVWYNYYRDRNMLDIGETEEWKALSSGEVDGIPYSFAELMQGRTRDYQKDYFTSALPFTQRGEEVLMPLEGSGTVTYLDTSRVFTSGGLTPADDTLFGTTAGQPSDFRVDKANAAAVGTDGRIENIDEVLLSSSNVSINDFRSAYALQVWLERNAIAGSRYTESIQAHFAVKPQDSRLQRPEYIGGGRIPVKISEVLTTAFSSDGEAIVPAGNMQGHGVTYGDTNRFKYYCPEHGFIIGIMSIMNPASYHQGMPRMFRRRSFLDYPWPTFAKLGEQIVEKAEIYATPATLTPGEDGTLPLFGYQSRYADWKYIPNSNHGEFHDTLLFWTLTRDFSAAPTLSSTFLHFDPTTQDRIFAVDGEGDNVWVYVHNKVGVKRALPYFGTPNTLGFS